MGRSWCRKFKGVWGAKRTPFAFRVCIVSFVTCVSRNSYLKDNCEQEKHVVSVLYRGCVLFYCLFCGTHRMTEICLVPLPYPYRFSVRVFFELLRERKCLKNALLSAVFKKFTNRKNTRTSACISPFLSHSQ